MPTMRYKITQEIIDKIKATVSAERGKAAELCRNAGIQQTQLTSILAKRQGSIQEDTWVRLCSVFPGLSDIARPIAPVGTTARPISALVGGGNVGAVQINRDNASGVQNGVQTSGEGIDAYRLRIQDRLLQEEDPIPVVKVLKIMKEEAP